MLLEPDICAMRTIDLAHAAAADEMLDLEATDPTTWCQGSPHDRLGIFKRGTRGVQDAPPCRGIQERGYALGDRWRKRGEGGVARIRSKRLQHIERVEDLCQIRLITCLHISPSFHATEDICTNGHIRAKFSPTVRFLAMPPFLFANTGGRAIMQARIWMLVGALLVAMPAVGQVVVLNGKSSIGSDSNSGRLLTIVSANSGGIRVSIKTDPAVALICDEKPVTTCSAWVKQGERITVSLRRPDSPRTPPGQGLPPTVAEWGRGCQGTISGGDCLVAMRESRSVSVDWSK
ncbi:hypothetical protein AB2M62_06250 [Sphingomonas sp. MMS12-HWE2-04]|uniref:hypothetical protein n=1 Tax=Sphingomonas sp. MMS12-HWE2-04 TaxID=3234199 RepID=UPI00385095DE